MDRARRRGVDLLGDIVTLPPFRAIAASIPGAVGSEPEGQLRAVASVEKQRLQGGPEKRQTIRVVRTARLRFQPLLQGRLDVVGRFTVPGQHLHRARLAFALDRLVPAQRFQRHLRLELPRESPARAHCVSLHQSVEYTLATCPIFRDHLTIHCYQLESTSPRSLPGTVPDLSHASRNRFVEALMSSQHQQAKSRQNGKAAATTSDQKLSVSGEYRICTRRIHLYFCRHPVL